MIKADTATETAEPAKQAKARALQTLGQPLDPHRLYSVDDGAARAGVCRGLMYRALSDDPAKRCGLPHLKSVKLGKARRLRGTAFLLWLDELEEAARMPD